MDIVFAGTPEFAAVHLNALAKVSDINIVGVCCRPDAPVGRKQVLQPCPVKLAAQSHSMPVYEPKTKADLTETLTALNPDMVIVVAFGMIFPPEIVNRFFCVNVHASVLPAYRGASPIHAALLNGDTETGITLIHMGEGLDDGPMIAVARCDIASNDNLGSLHDKLAALGAESLLNALGSKAFQDPSAFVQQAHDKATFCHKLGKQDRMILPDTSPETKWNQIRAFSPAPGAIWMEGNTPIKVLAASLENGVLSPTQLIPPGKKAMSYDDYKRGYGALSLC